MRSLRFRLGAATGAVLLGALLLAPVAMSATQSTSRPADASGTSSAFSDTQVISRDNLINGKNEVVDKRTFTVTVSQTEGLRNRQEVQVNWTGAHPTGGLVSDINSGYGAAGQEYPVVLIECRGTDSTSVPVADQVSPQTCFTETPLERSFTDNQNAFPPYRVDRYASVADRGAVVGLPSPLPAACSFADTGIQHWIPFISVTGTVYYGGGGQGCAGLPPEDNIQQNALEPADTVYAQTDTTGAGSDKFVINTNETNASLGCSSTVPCSLEIIPIEGISCDPSAVGLPPDDVPDPQQIGLATSVCTETGAYTPGQDAGVDNIGDLAVTGELWWSASNWRNRVNVPLNFSAPSNLCDLVNSATPIYIYGSELMAEATQQWEPAFCTNPKLFKFQHVQSSEPEAKNLLETGSVEAAFAEEPPSAPFTTPTVQAPTAVTGFAITFDIDDSHGQEQTSLNLDARLLAKLLTESYPSNTALQASDPALEHNPVDLEVDPEFQALNPGVDPEAIDIEPSSVLFSIDSDSDALYALTSYINSDPEARAWLNGAPDPWGMVVNPAYKGIALPTDLIPELDTFEPTSIYTSTTNPCLQKVPVPYLPLVAGEVNNLADVALNMQYDIANSQIACTINGNSESLGPIGREQPGEQFILGLTSLSAAQAYDLDTASLQTYVSPTAPVKFTDATGRTFVSPTPAGLDAAARIMAPNPTTGSFSLPYGDLDTAVDADAYPGTLLVTTDVPTSGLSASDAAKYAAILNFAATTGQEAGTGNGQLPAGYLPMTAANGLASEVAYTEDAAKAVADQTGFVPSVTDPQPPPATPSAVTTTSAPTSGSEGASTPAAGASEPTVAAQSVPSPLVSTSDVAAPDVAPTSSAPVTTPVAATTYTSSLSTGLAGLVLPIILVLAVVGGIAAVLMLFRRGVSP